MYCPECSAEYVEGVAQCAHCGVSLVRELPEGEIFSSPERMAESLRGKEVEAIIVGTYVGLREMQRLLAAERIATVIAGEAQDEIEPGMHARLFLMVEVGQIEATRAFFKRRWEAGLEIEGLMLKSEDALREGACPACGTTVPPDVAECPECGLFLGNPDAADGAS